MRGSFNADFRNAALGRIRHAHNLLGRYSPLCQMTRRGFQYNLESCFLGDFERKLAVFIGFALKKQVSFHVVHYHRTTFGRPASTELALCVNSVSFHPSKDRDPVGYGGGHAKYKP